MRTPHNGRLATWLAIVFLAATLLIVALDLAGTRQQGEGEARNQAASLSLLLEERLSSGLRETNLILQSISDSSQVQALLQNHVLSQEQQQKLRQLADAKLRQQAYLTRIDVLDSACATLFSSQRGGTPSQLKTDYCRWYHRTGVQDTGFMSTRPDAGGKNIVLALKLLSPTGEPLGMVIGTMDRQFFQSEVSKLPVGNHGEILVMDLRQVLMANWPAYPRAQEQPLGELVATEVFSRHEETLLFSANSLLDAERRIYSTRLVEGFPLRVLVGIGERDFSRPFNDKATMALLAWLFTAALTIVALRSHLAGLRQNRLLADSAQRIRQSEEMARLILDTAPVALLLVAMGQWRILRANAPARELLRMPGPPPGDKQADRTLDLPLQLAPLSDWLRDGTQADKEEVELEREDLTRLWAIVSIQYLPDHQPPAALVSLYDISSRKALEQELEEKNRQLNDMAVTDPLTRLANRRHADQTLKEEVVRCERYSQPLSIAVFDIDHFKQFNDSFGHQAGDNVLLAVANSLVDGTRGTDVCARIGGEEFLVIFPCTRLKDAEKVMQRVQMMLARTIFPFTDEKVTFSGGLTAWQPGDTPSSMLSRADKLLYQAKMSGRDLMLSDKED